MAINTDDVWRRFLLAQERRAGWERHWQECYDFALPQRQVFGGPRPGGAKRTDRLFDGTAADAVDQVAASLLAHLTPPWSRWAGLCMGADADAVMRETGAPALDRAVTVLQSHFDRSNFAVEIHQAYLDLVTAGTACLLFEEAPVGEFSAFRFTAVPLDQIAVEEGPSGRLDALFRVTQPTEAELTRRFSARALESLGLAAKSGAATGDPARERRHRLVEAVLPDEQRFAYWAFLGRDGGFGTAAPPILASGGFATSPFITFRWMKAPGEIYGRSPVMKALPDIKTANKVVELVLKNASIAVTGIWQAEDDGVLNPATIKLVPGTIIPKAVGSAGLTPLEAPGRFDVSELVLDQLRSRIRSALLVDQLGPVQTTKMTATEVIERSAETARLLGATYGRLQSELLTPLIVRAFAVLARRGEVPPIRIDGRTVDIRYDSPLARLQSQTEARSVLLWLQALSSLGPDVGQYIDTQATAAWLGRAFGVPEQLARKPERMTLTPDEAAAEQSALSDIAMLLAAAPEMTGTAASAVAASTEPQP